MLGRRDRPGVDCDAHGLQDLHAGAGERLADRRHGRAVLVAVELHDGRRDLLDDREDRAASPPTTATVAVNGGTRAASSRARSALRFQGTGSG